jgi:hypothetical protein
MPIGKNSIMLEQIRLAKAQLDHLGSCRRASKTPEQLADMDNRFFAAMDQLKDLQLEQEAALVRRQAYGATVTVLKK